MSKGPFLRKYGVQTTFNFDLFEIDGVDLRKDSAPGTADLFIMKDEGAEAATTNAATDEGRTYSLVLTATEMQAARIKVVIEDQTGPKTWLDTSITIETYGNASAQHAVDLDDSVRAGLTGLANAVPGASGGLLIAGTNAPVTITGSGDALTLTSTGGNGDGLAVTGDGTGDGISATSGAGSTGNGILATANSTNGQGFQCLGSGTGAGIQATAGANGQGIQGKGGSTSGNGIQGLAGGAGSGLNCIGSGSSSGIFAGGGTTGNGMQLTGGGTSGDALSTSITSGVNIDADIVAEIADGVWDEALTGGTHNVVNSAGRRLRQLQEAGGYTNGFVYLDTVNGVSGTTDFENGVDVSPSDTIGNANTIATSVGLNRFMILPGSSITLAATQSNQEFEGQNWTLALGGQSISGSHISGANVTGIGSGASEFHFEHCELGNCIIDGAHMDFCDILGTITLAVATDYFFVDCAHAGGTAEIDFGAAIGNTTVHLHGWKGAITIKNMGQSGTDVLHFDSAGGKLTLDSTCIGGTVNMNGTFSLVDSSSGMTLNRDGDIINRTLAVMDADTITLPGQEAPPLTPTRTQMAAWIYKMARNRKKQDATSWLLYADNETTVDAKATVSDDGTDAIKQEIVSGP